LGLDASGKLTEHPFGKRGSHRSAGVQQEACQIGTSLTQTADPGCIGLGAVQRGLPRQRIQPRGDIRCDQIANAPIGLIQAPGRIDQPATLLVHILGGGFFQTAAQHILAHCAPDDAIDIQPGKRLPFRFQHGKHLPQDFAQIERVQRASLPGLARAGSVNCRIWLDCKTHQLVFRNKSPAATMASPILAGTSGYVPLCTALRISSTRV